MKNIKESNNPEKFNFKYKNGHWMYMDNNGNYHPFDEDSVEIKKVINDDFSYTDSEGKTHLMRWENGEYKEIK